jgi:hypothetical protein
MLGAAPIQNAATISIAVTLRLLDEDFKELAVGVARGEYALWLGSGISRERVPDLRIVVRRVLDHLSCSVRDVLKSASRKSANARSVLILAQRARNGASEASTPHVGGEYLPQASP